jgi:hypothetical protein
MLDLRRTVRSPRTEERAARVAGKYVRHDGSLPAVDATGEGAARLPAPDTESQGPRARRPRAADDDHTIARA